MESGDDVVAPALAELDSLVAGRLRQFALAFSGRRRRSAGNELNHVLHFLRHFEIVELEQFERVEGLRRNRRVRLVDNACRDRLSRAVEAERECGRPHLHHFDSRRKGVIFRLLLARAETPVDFACRPYVVEAIFVNLLLHVFRQFRVGRIRKFADGKVAIHFPLLQTLSEKAVVQKVEVLRRPFLYVEEPFRDRVVVVVVPDDSLRIRVDVLGSRLPHLADVAAHLGEYRNIEATSVVRNNVVALFHELLYAGKFCRTDKSSFVGVDSEPLLFFVSLGIVEYSAETEEISVSLNIKKYEVHFVPFGVWFKPFVCGDNPNVYIDKMGPK